MKGKMKKVISLLLSIAMIFTSVNILPSTVEAAVNSSSGSSSWSLVWNDEFNQTVGGAPDSSTWSYDTGHGDNGWGNQEVQRYTNSTDNVRIVDMSSDSGSTDGKALAITAKRENGEITSGRIKTLNKQYMKYGRVEARLRLDDGMRSGVWPAFWMMGNDIESGASWPYCGEIDIMEHRNAEKQIISTLHWNTGTGTSANYNHIYAHEMAHKSAGGQFAGAISIERNSEGIPVSGHVPIQMPTLNKKNPQQTIDHANTVIRAAMAPSDPSGQDYKVANQASQIKMQAQALKNKNQGKKLDVQA